MKPPANVRLLLATCLTMASVFAHRSYAQSDVQHALLPHPTDAERDVEVYWQIPEGEGPWPAILYVHGHQIGSKPGARFYVDRGILSRAAERGMVAAAVSQPGYGKSGGAADYCGPASRQAVEIALDFLRQKPQVRPAEVLLYGYSRGAIVASVVATRDTALAGLILGAGAYDIAAQYAQLNDSPNNAGLRLNIEREAGTTKESFRDRSSLFRAAHIRAPTLILHGENDTTCPTDQAIRLASLLRESGTPTELKIFPGVGHHIPREMRGPIIDAFVDRTLRLSSAK